MKTDSSITVSIGIYLTFENFISFRDALELGEDGGEHAGLQRAFKAYMKDMGVETLIANADKVEFEIDEVVRP